MAVNLFYIEFTALLWTYRTSKLIYFVIRDLSIFSVATYLRTLIVFGIDQCARILLGWNRAFQQPREGIGFSRWETALTAGCRMICLDFTPFSRRYIVPFHYPIIDWHRRCVRLHLMFASAPSER